MRADDMNLIYTLQNKVNNNQINFIPSTIEGQYKYVNDDIMIVLSLKNTSNGAEYTLDLYNNSETKKYSISQKYSNDPKECSDYNIMQSLYLSISYKSDEMHNKFISSIIESIDKDNNPGRVIQQTDTPKIIGDNAAIENA